MSSRTPDDPPTEFSGPVDWQVDRTFQSGVEQAPEAHRPADDAPTWIDPDPGEATVLTPPARGSRLATPTPTAPLTTPSPPPSGCSTISEELVRRAPLPTTPLGWLTPAIAVWVAVAAALFGLLLVRGAHPVLDLWLCAPSVMVPVALLATVIASWQSYRPLGWPFVQQLHRGWVLAGLGATFAWLPRALEELGISRPWTVSAGLAVLLLGLLAAGGALQRKRGVFAVTMLAAALFFSWRFDSAGVRWFVSLGTAWLLPASLLFFLRRRWTWPYSRPRRLFRMALLCVLPTLALWGVATGLQHKTASELPAVRKDLRELRELAATYSPARPDDELLLQGLRQVAGRLPGPDHWSRLLAASLELDSDRPDAAFPDEVRQLLLGSSNLRAPCATQGKAPAVDQLGPLLSLICQAPRLSGGPERRFRDGLKERVPALRAWWETLGLLLSRAGQPRSGLLWSPVNGRVFDALLEHEEQQQRLARLLEGEVERLAGTSTTLAEATVLAALLRRELGRDVRVPRLEPQAALLLPLAPASNGPLPAAVKLELWPEFEGWADFFARAGCVAAYDDPGWQKKYSGFSCTSARWDDLQGEPQLVFELRAVFNRPTGKRGATLNGFWYVLPDGTGESPHQAVQQALQAGGATLTEERALALPAGTRIGPALCLVARKFGEQGVSVGLTPATGRRCK